MNESQPALIVGISGASCAGKSTLAQRLASLLPNGRVVNQDEYYYLEEYEGHQWIPGLNHINWELVSAFNMDRLWRDIHDQTQDPRPAEKASPAVASLLSRDVMAAVSAFSRRVVILDGITLFQHSDTLTKCDLKYYVTLDHEEAALRRSQRDYDPPDVPGYFERVVWPHYKQSEATLKARSSHEIQFLNGKDTMKINLNLILREILAI